jgi:hypothetical protein
VVDEEELTVGVCEDAGVVVAVVGVVAAVDVAEADVLAGLETSGDGGEPSGTQPLSHTANVNEVIAKTLRRPRKPVIMAPR